MNTDYEWSSKQKLRIIIKILQGITLESISDFYGIKKSQLKDWYKIFLLNGHKSFINDPENLLKENEKLKWIIAEMLQNKKKKEKEVIIILCKPSFKLSKTAIDYLEAQGKTKSIVTLMLEDADIKFCHGIKSRAFEVLKSNIRKNVIQEIVVVTKLDPSRFTLKEHYQFIKGSVSSLTKAFPGILMSGMSYDEISGQYYVFK